MLVLRCVSGVAFAVAVSYKGFRAWLGFPFGSFFACANTQSSDLGGQSKPVPLSVACTLHRSGFGFVPGLVSIQLGLVVWGDGNLATESQHRVGG